LGLPGKAGSSSTKWTCHWGCKEKQGNSPFSLTKRSMAMRLTILTLLKPHPCTIP